MLRLGRVTATHPEDHSVDVLMLDDGASLPAVQVLSGLAGTDFGSSGLTTPDLSSPSNQWALAASNTRDILCVVGMVSRTPVVLGFLFPQVAQALFERKNFMVNRHPSDVYSTISDSGDVEVYHPSGTYLRIAANPAHEDLTAKDYDKIWAISKNTASAVHVHLKVANAGTSVASLDIDPAGNVTMQNNGNLQATIGGTTTVVSGGAVHLTCPSLLVTCPTSTFTGDVLVEGQLTYQAGLIGSGGTGATASITGTIHATGDISAGGISLEGHRHGDAQGGTVGPPT